MSIQDPTTEKEPTTEEQLHVSSLIICAIAEITQDNFDTALRFVQQLVDWQNKTYPPTPMELLEIEHRRHDQELCRIDQLNRG